MIININRNITCISIFQWKLAGFKSNRTMIAGTELDGNIQVMYNMRIVTQYLINDGSAGQLN